jgi:hypothetical protein
VALERELRVLRPHSLAVVFDANEPLAPEFDRDADSCRARVDGILDKLLDDRRRSLDDLAGGNLVGEFRRETVDA